MACYHVAAQLDLFSLKYLPLPFLERKGAVVLVNQISEFVLFSEP